MYSAPNNVSAIFYQIFTTTLIIQYASILVFYGWIPSDLSWIQSNAPWCPVLFNNAKSFTMIA